MSRKLEKTLVIRADASSLIGTGHIMRTLALAQLFKKSVKVQYVCAEITNELLNLLIKEQIEVKLLNEKLGTKEELLATINYIKLLNTQWIIIDGYEFDESYISGLKDTGLKVLLIDDFGQLNYYAADIVLNRGVYAREDMYLNREPYTELLLGPKFTVLREEFLRWKGVPKKIKKVPRNLLVTMGGADPNNITLKIINMFDRVLLDHYTIKVVLGAANTHANVIKERVKRINIDVELIEIANEMPTLMNWADIAITAGGTTLFEMAFMGLPSAVIQIAENQRSAKVLAEKYNTCIFIGEDRKILDTDIKKVISILQDPKMRYAMSVNGQRLIDGDGNKRIIKKMDLEGGL
ncbi:UDP-2,4-diacetamido-2,4,6-trideoxy-beta-L-altropyranose hydrolase [Metabacillus fastidiosus]|uniref:UDP-2,4-diacetamido-2,4, 6-trideoxy-beta-L-altropyranose hydrolase n=1 Tax=Metabacillus fastidiosus TaxID=1458 RepID=UPI003D26E863